MQQLSKAIDTLASGVFLFPFTLLPPNALKMGFCIVVNADVLEEGGGRSVYATYCSWHSED